jgi:hypothetical protein
MFNRPAEAVERRTPRGGRALLAALSLASLPGPALAQDTPRAPIDTSEAATTEDRLVLLNFSRCVAGRQRTQARALILADYTTEAYRDTLRRMAASQHGCLPNGSGRLRFGGVLFAGDLAEILLGEAAPRGTLAARAALNPAAAPLQARDQGEVMSICLVRAIPAETEALLGTEQGSAEEHAALRVIGPHIGDCLAAGAQLRINRPGLRAMLALSAYRLVQHNAAPATPGAGGN